MEDSRQIDYLVDNIFTKEEHEEGMFFDEFCKYNIDVNSDLFVSIYDCIYQYIPCASNFLLMRANYKTFL